MAGTAINDTSSVVAAATVYGAVATSQVVVVKLTRTLMSIPISVGHSVARHRRERAAETSLAGGMPLRRPVSAFLLLFLVASALNTIGLSTPVRAMVGAGWWPLALGGVLCGLVAASSLAIVSATGQR